jgi:hypothetical protein
VPWCASSKRPIFCDSAPVNAPRSWPNHSLSSSPAGEAAQLTVTSVRARRAACLYPVYFAVIMGMWQLLGAAAIAAPGLPRVKEWAYAGMYFTLTGAALSHAAAGDPLTKILVPLALLVAVVTSRTLQPGRDVSQESRRVERRQSHSPPEHRERREAVARRWSAAPDRGLGTLTADEHHRRSAGGDPSGVGSHRLHLRSAHGLLQRFRRRKGHREHLIKRRSALRRGMHSGDGVRTHILEHVRLLMQKREMIAIVAIEPGRIGWLRVENDQLHL